MKKPNNFDNTKPFTDYVPLEAGGYVCKIIGVEETKSRAGNNMVKIALDISEGPESGRFERDYKADTRSEKKWPCVVYQLTEDNDGNASRGFVTFCDAVVESNSGFEIQWEEQFSECFKGKLVGAVFGREQYQNQKGELKWSTKCRNFKTVEDIKNENFAMPSDKYLDVAKANGFQSVDDYSDDDEDSIPF